MLRESWRRSRRDAAVPAAFVPGGGHGACSRGVTATSSGADMLIRMLIAGTLLLAQAAAAADLARSSIRSGGVGEEERQALERDGRYNLKLIAARRDGAYLADVGVTILDQRGAEVLATRMEGPWLLAELPPGRYRVVADYRGTTQRRDVTVGQGARSEVVLQWAGDEPPIR